MKHILQIFFVKLNGSRREQVPVYFSVAFVERALCSAASLLQYLYYEIAEI